MEIGQLFLVATPIGNLGDLTYRAVDVLRRVDAVFAEDTRHTRRLCQHYQINTPLISLHAHNEAARITQVVERLSAGQQLALVSDAGTPLISDPGERLVATLRAEGHRVTPIPGPCALIAALSVSGLSTRRFAFEGFFPVQYKEKCILLEHIAVETRTTVFYESTHRIVATLSFCNEHLGAEREVVVARELTKTFETVLTGTLGEVFEAVSSSPAQQKGEFVVLIGGVSVETTASLQQAQAMLPILLEEVSVKQTAKLLSRLTTVPKRVAYQMALDYQAQSERSLHAPGEE